MIFPSPRILFCIYPFKENLPKNLTLQKAIQNPVFLALSGRPLAEQNCSVGRPGSRPTCTNVYCTHRSTVPVDRQIEQSSLFVPVDRPDRPTESVTLCLGLRSTGPVDHFPNGRKSDRWRSTGPVDRQQPESADRFQRLYFCLSFVGASPNEYFGLFNPVFIPYK